MKIIAVHGPGNAGKTETIKLALRIQLEEFSPRRIVIDLPIGSRNYYATSDDVAAIPEKRGGRTNADENTDIIVMLELDDLIVVFGSQGDKPGDLVNLKRKADSWKTDVLICATKAIPSDTVKEVESWGRKGEDVEWIEKPLNTRFRFSRDDQQIDNARIAGEILAIIKDYQLERLAKRR